MSEKKDISSRFVEVLNELLRQGKVPDKKAFASAVGCSTSMITEISKGRSNVGTSVIQNTVQIYDVSATWLLTGAGEMFADEVKNSGDPMLDRLMNMLEKKDEIIRRQAEEIGQLRAKIDELKIRLQKTASDASTSGIANVG